MTLVAQLATATALADARFLSRGVSTHQYIRWLCEKVGQTWLGGREWRLPAHVRAATQANCGGLPRFVCDVVRVFECRAIQTPEVVAAVGLWLHAVRLAGARAEVEADERVQHVLWKARKADAVLDLPGQALLLAVIVLFLH